MWLIRTIHGDKILDSVDEIKNTNKKDVVKIYSLSEVEYDTLISTSDIRDCIYKYLKGKQLGKDEVVNYVSEVLDIKKADVSKVITSMKKEKIIYTVRDFGWIGID
mgnify:FL=1